LAKIPQQQEILLLFTLRGNEHCSRFDDDTETIKPPNHPPMATDNHPPMNTNSPLSLITNCVFSGPPPEPYTYWSTYFNEVSESGVLYGLKISACGSMNSMLKLNGEG
jgi:hypothetical protein